MAIAPLQQAAAQCGGQEMPRRHLWFPRSGDFAVEFPAGAREASSGRFARHYEIGQRVAVEHGEPPS
jgi:hypothetical protein